MSTQKFTCDMHDKTTESYRGLAIGDVLYRCYEYGSTTYLKDMADIKNGKNVILPIQEYKVTSMWLETIPPKNKWDKVHRIMMVSLEDTNDVHKQIETPVHLLESRWSLNAADAKNRVLKELSQDNARYAIMVENINAYIQTAQNQIFKPA